MAAVHQQASNKADEERDDIGHRLNGFDFYILAKVNGRLWLCECYNALGLV
jgi:hypothetical protein